MAAGGRWATLNSWCPDLEDVRIPSRALKTLISRARSGIKLDRDPGSTSNIADPRGRVVASIEKVRNSVTPQMASEMVELYKSGASANEVARAFNVHRQTVARHLRSSGRGLRTLGLTDAQSKQAKELYLSGQTLAQVGSHFGVAQGTVGRSLRKLGVELRPALVSADVAMGL